MKNIGNQFQCRYCGGKLHADSSIIVGYCAPCQIRAGVRKPGEDLTVAKAKQIEAERKKAEANQ